MRVLLLGILYIAPVIDSFTGYFMGISGNDNNISKVYRMVSFSTLYLLCICKSKENQIVKQILLTCILGIYLLYYAVLSGKVLTDSSYIMKLFYPIILTVALKVMYIRREITNMDINKVIDFYSVFYPICILVPTVFGVGHSAYGSNNGYMGFFSGGNEISIVLGMLFMINVQKIYTTLENKKTIVYAIITGFTLVMTQTKTSYIIVLLTLLLFVYKKMRKFHRSIGKNMAMLLLISICIVAFSYIQREQIVIMIDRLTFKYHQLGDSFINMLFSNRQNKIIPILKENYTPDIKGVANFIFGKGFYAQVLESKLNGYTVGLVEMDLFDVLFQNGILILCIIIHFYWKIMKLGIESGDIFLALTYVMALLFSTFAGHVLYNPLSSTVLAILSVYVYANSNKCVNEIKNQLKVM